MKKGRFDFLYIIFALILICLVSGTGEVYGQAAPFEEVTIRFEQNATDGDVEVVFDVKSRADGLVQLTIVSPDGRTVVDFKAPDKSTMGIRSFQFESPEPEDIESLKKAYPEGVYKFSAAAADGFKFYGEATLNHKLPATVSFLLPKADAEDVEYEKLEITWSPVKNLAAYMIEIEQEESGEKIQARLSGSVTRFAVPNGFLRPGNEYKLGIGTVSEKGNISFVETSFTTAEKE